jgi:hypothetical protein
MTLIVDSDLYWLVSRAEKVWDSLTHPLIPIRSASHPDPFIR